MEPLKTCMHQSGSNAGIAGIQYCKFPIDKGQTNELHQLAEKILSAQDQKLGEFAHKALREELMVLLAKLRILPYCFKHASDWRDLLLMSLTPNQHNTIKSEAEAISTKTIENHIFTLRVFSAYMNWVLAPKGYAVQEVQTMLLRSENRIYMAVNCVDEENPKLEALSQASFEYSGPTDKDDQRTYLSLEKNEKRTYPPTASTLDLRPDFLNSFDGSYKHIDGATKKASDAARPEDKRPEGRPVLLYGKYYSEKTHAEQGLLLILAHRLAAGKIPTGDVIIAGKKLPCSVCAVVLSAFQAAYKKAYDRVLYYCDDAYCKGARDYEVDDFVLFDLHKRALGELNTNNAREIRKKMIEGIKNSMNSSIRVNSPASCISLSEIENKAKDKRFEVLRESYELDLTRRGMNV